MQVMSGHELRVFKKICFDCSEDSANVVGTPADDDYDVKFNGLFNGIYEVNIPYELVQGKRDASGRRGKDVKKKLYPGYVLLKAELYDAANAIIIPNLEYVKNVKSVIVPNTNGMKGIKAAVAVLRHDYLVLALDKRARQVDSCDSRLPSRAVF